MLLQFGVKLCYNYRYCHWNKTIIPYSMVADFPSQQWVEFGGCNIDRTCDLYEAAFTVLSTTRTKCWLACQRLILAWPLLPLFDLKLQSRGQDWHALGVVVVQLCLAHSTATITHTSTVKVWFRATCLPACCKICLTTSADVKYKLLNVIFVQIGYLMYCTLKMPYHG